MKVNEQETAAEKKWKLQAVEEPDDIGEVDPSLPTSSANPDVHDIMAEPRRRTINDSRKIKIVAHKYTMYHKPQYDHRREGSLPSAFDGCVNH